MRVRDCVRSPLRSLSRAGRHSLAFGRTVRVQVPHILHIEFNLQFGQVSSENFAVWSISRLDCIESSKIEIKQSLRLPIQMSLCMKITRAGLFVVCLRYSRSCETAKKRPMAQFCYIMKTALSVWVLRLCWDAWQTAREGRKQSGANQRSQICMFASMYL